MPASAGVDDDGQRAVEAGAEALGEQVVGAALGRVEVGLEPPSGSPSFMCSAGSATAPRTARLTSIDGSGRAVTKRAQRCPSARAGCAGARGR